jgi:oligopeptidase B
MRPELFRACILDVPFLDVLSCLLDPDLPLAKTDYLEFGNPLADAKIYELISSYSPYDNLARGQYPSLFLNLALNDPRVPGWSTLKFVEKMRDLS